MAESDIFIDILPGPDYRALFRIPRKLVEARDVASATTAFERLTATLYMVRTIRSRVGLVFDGYDEELLDLWCMPEVRSYLSELDRAFPSLLLVSRSHDGSLLLLAACCCESAQSVAAPGKTAMMFLPCTLSHFLLAHFEAVEAAPSAIS